MERATNATTLNGAGTASPVPAVLVGKSTRRKPPALPNHPMSLLDAIVYAASDPAMDVAKVERLITLHRDMEAQAAERAFNDALAAAQAEMQPIVADAVNQHANGHKYATYARLDRAIRPIYSSKGLALTFTTGERTNDTSVEMVAHLIGHGHSRRYVLLMPADGKGARGGDVMSRTHATASACSYGMRYLAVMIFNLSIDRDDDGNAASRKPKSSAQLKRDGVWPQFEQEMRAARSLVALQNVVERWRPRVGRWTDKWRGAAEELHSQRYEALGGTMAAFQQAAESLEGRP